MISLIGIAIVMVVFAAGLLFYAGSKKRTRDRAVTAQHLDRREHRASGLN
jgi:predicted cation transporter